MEKKKKDKRILGLSMQRGNKCNGVEQSNGMGSENSQIPTKKWVCWNKNLETVNCIIKFGGNKMRRNKNVAKNLSTKTCSAGDVLFTGIKCTNGQNPEISFKMRDCINRVDVEVSIPRSSLTPQNLEKTIIEHNGFCKDAKIVESFQS